MKTNNYLKILLLAFVGTVVFNACQKDGQTATQSVEGTYVGSFTTTQIV